MAKWLLIDGFNLVYRCFHAIPELTRADGFPTNALHGWMKSLWKFDDQEKPDATLVFFDLGGAQDRLALHPEYKAQRAEMPESLVKQLPYVKSLTRAMGLVGVELNGVESDDLLASQAQALAAAGHEVLIVSADKDFAQIVGDHVKILLPPPRPIRSSAGASSMRRAWWRSLAFHPRKSRTTSRWSAIRRTTSPASTASARRPRRSGCNSSARSKA